MEKDIVLIIECLRSASEKYDTSGDFILLDDLRLSQQIIEEHLTSESAVTKIFPNQVRNTRDDRYT